jgi:hypothetical protein
LLISFCVIAEGDQLVADLVDFPLAMLFFTARCFTRIYKSKLRAMHAKSWAQGLAMAVAAETRS